MSARHLGLAVAALAAGVVTLTGCAANTTSGHAAAPAVRTATSDCGRTGTSAGAAGATVHCYLTALATSDTDTACSVLSAHVRGQIAADADTGNDTSSAYRVPGTDGTSSLDSDCATVAPLMRRALDSMSSTARTELQAALSSVHVERTRVTGATASVDIMLTTSGRTGTQTVALVQDGGRWMIDSSSAFATAR